MIIKLNNNVLDKFGDELAKMVEEYENSIKEKIYLGDCMFEPYSAYVSVGDNGLKVNAFCILEKIQSDNVLNIAHLFSKDKNATSEFLRFIEKLAKKEFYDNLMMIRSNHLPISKLKAFHRLASQNGFECKLGIIDDENILKVAKYIYAKKLRFEEL